MLPYKHKVSETVVFSALGWKTIEAHTEFAILERANPKHCVELRLLLPQSLETSEERLLAYLTLILRRSRMGTVWFYTSTSNKRAARPKLYTKSLTRDLKLMYIRLTLVRISINL